MTRVDKFHRRLIPAVLISLCLTFPIDEAGAAHTTTSFADVEPCLLYTSPSPRD